MTHVGPQMPAAATSSALPRLEALPEWRAHARALPLGRRGRVTLKGWFSSFASSVSFRLDPWVSMTGTVLRLSRVPCK